jgi:hypothetical protein
VDCTRLGPSESLTWDYDLPDNVLSWSTRGGDRVAPTLSTVLCTRGSGEVVMRSEEAVETAASGPVAGPVAGS